MKSSLLFLGIFLVYGSAYADYTCYARYGAPNSEFAAPCEPELKLDLSASNLKKVGVISADFKCSGATLGFVLSTMEPDSLRATIAVNQRNTWSVYDLKDHSKFWLGMNSKEVGFAEISCLKN